MCFGGPSGPTDVENKAAAEQKVEAEAQTQKAVQERAQQKAEDVQEAISSRTARAGRSSGARGRSLLFKSSKGGAGFLGRFDK